MTYRQKRDAAKRAIGAYNKKQTDEAKQVDIEAFVQALVDAGGTDDASLQDCSFEDLEEFGLPKLLAKKVAKTFREKKKKKDEDEGAPYVSGKKAKRMSIKQLLRVYDPREPDNEVGKLLGQKSQGKACIVFTNSGEVNVAASHSLFAEIREHYPERDTITVDGKPRKVYKIGQRPDQLGNVNPLYPRELLYPDGTCGQTNRSWSAVPYEVRAIIFLAVTETNEISISGISDAHGILDLVVSGAGEAVETKIRQRFSKASVRFDELKGLGNPPSLKRGLNGTGIGIGPKNDPFSPGGSGHTSY